MYVIIASTMEGEVYGKGLEKEIVMVVVGREGEVRLSEALLQSLIWRDGERICVVCFVCVTTDTNK